MCLITKLQTKVIKFLPTFSVYLDPDLESFLFPLVHPQPYFTDQFTICLYNKVRELENTTTWQLKTSKDRPDLSVLSLSLSLSAHQCNSKMCGKAEKQLSKGIEDDFYL